MKKLLTVMILLLTMAMPVHADALETPTAPDEAVDLMPAERRSFATVGTVVYVNHDHKYFTAEYDCLGSKQRDSFKFYYLGKMVKILGH